MLTKTEITAKLKTIFKIMLPIYITQTAIMGMSVSDTVMSGHAGTDSLAGVSIGVNLWMPFSTGLTGILLALTPIVAQFLGAGKHQKIAQAFWNGIYLAVILGLLIISIGSASLELVLGRLNLAPSVHQVARDYLTGVACGIIPFFMNIICRSVMDTLGYPQVTMKLFLLTLPVNIFFNYLLIFGKMGLPALGGAGAGYGTALTYWLMLAVFFWLIYKIPRFRQLGVTSRQPFSWPRLNEHLRLGIPSGLAILLETSIWSIVGLFMAKFGTQTIAAHQAAINFSSLLYMLPLSFALSLTILIGIQVGAKKYREAAHYSFIGIGANITLALIFVILLFTCRSYIASLYGTQGRVWELARQFLLYAAFFQLLDGTATPIQGILRGYKDVRFGFWSSLISYWCICLPCGYCLDVYGGQGPFGYWQGLIVGIFFSALLMSTRLIHLQHRYRQD